MAFLGNFFKTKTNPGRIDFAPYQASHLSNLAQKGQEFYQKYASPTEFERQTLQRGQEFYGGPGGQLGQQMTGMGQQLAQMGMQGIKNFQNYRAPQAQLDMQALQQAYTNPFAQEAIDSYSRDVSRALAEDILPNLRNQAASRNLMGSSRQGIAEGIAAGKAAQSISSNAAQMRSQQYQMGYGTAEQFGLENVRNRMNSDQLRMNMNNQILNQGLGAMGTGFGLSQQGLEGGLGIGGYERGLQSNALNQYQSLVGNPIYTAGTIEDSPFSKLLNTAAVGMGITGGMSGKK